MRAGDAGELLLEKFSARFAVAERSKSARKVRRPRSRSTTLPSLSSTTNCWPTSWAVNSDSIVNPQSSKLLESANS
jgi:hypothetical protein